MKDTQLNKIKRRLGISEEDTLENQLIIDLIDDAESQFMGITGESYVPNAYFYMIEDVVYKLYAQKGSEGVLKETIDGYSVEYSSSKGLFEPYMDILKRDFELEQSLQEKGRVMFF